MCQRDRRSNTHQPSCAFIVESFYLPMIQAGGCGWQTPAAGTEDTQAPRLKFRGEMGQIRMIRRPSPRKPARGFRRHLRSPIAAPHMLEHGTVWARRRVETRPIDTVSRKPGEDVLSRCGRHYPKYQPKSAWPETALYSCAFIRRKPRAARRHTAPKHRTAPPEAPSPCLKKQKIPQSALLRQEPPLITIEETTVSLQGTHNIGTPITGQSRRGEDRPDNRTSYDFGLGR